MDCLPGTLRPRILATTFLCAVTLPIAAMAQTSVNTPSVANVPAVNPNGAGLSSGSGSPKAIKAAQESPETVTVVGLRKSLQRAIEIKRKANAVVDVISAEDVGKFPDTNVAESLSHLQGVAVDHQFGEGERVSINGTDPALNRILIDGHNIASTDWGGNPNDPTSRAFNYSELSPEIINTAEVFKSPEARLDDGALGGTVLIHTRRPLDLTPWTVAASGGYAYNDRSADGNPRGSGVVSWHNPQSTFGILASAGYTKENLTRAGVEYFGYDPGSQLLANNPTITGGTAAQAAAARYPAGINMAYFTQERARQTYQADMQWRPIPDLVLNLNGLYINEVFNNINHAEYIYPASVPGSAQSINVANGLINQANFGSNYSEADLGFRKSTVVNKTLSLDGTWTHDAWQLYANGGYTTANGGKDPEYLLNFENSSPYSYAFNGTQTAVNYAVSPTIPTAFAANALSEQSVKGQSFYGQQVGGIDYQQTRDSEGFGQLDLRRDVDWGPLKRLLAGVKYTAHDNGQDGNGANTYVTSPGSLADLPGLGATPSGLFDGLGVSGNATQFTTVGDSNDITSYISSQKTVQTGPIFTSIYDVRENIAAGYVQANFSGARYRGNLGVRLVSTSDDSKFYETMDNGATYQQTAVDTKYFKALPAFNFLYDVTDNLLARFAVAKVIARPRYSDLAGAVSLDDQELTGSGGNPNLKPYSAINGEVSAEYYFNRHSLLDMEFFYRDISNYIVQITTLQNEFSQLAQAQEPYFITSPINASNAKVYGFAPSITTDLGYGFGITVNYTYAFADTANGLNLPFLSTHTVNVIPYYEHGPWQTRLSYNYRSKYFTGIGRLNSNDTTDGYTELDYSLTYNLTKRGSITFNASNLLDSTYFSFSGTKNAPTAYYKNGRVFSLSAAYKF